MSFFDTKNNGSPIELARELNSKSHTVDWESFTREAAVLHMFIQLTPDLDARREASEILKTKPQGDYLLLIEKLQNLENAPWKENKKLFSKSVKPQCETCSRPGHKTCLLWQM